MSRTLYIGVVRMSYEERGQWVYLVANVLTFGAYVAIVFGQVATRPLAEVDFVSTMVWAIGVAIAISIGGRIFVAIANPGDEQIEDVRDRDIGRQGEYFGGTILGIGMVVPFVLTLAKVDHFWIANAMYAAFALSALIGTAFKVVAYRRGL